MPNKTDTKSKEEKKSSKNKKIEPFVKDIKVYDKDYIINQILPIYSDMYFEVNDKNELIKFEYIKHNGENVWIKELFSKVPVFIKSICKNIETDEEKIEILYYQPRIKKWQTMMVEKTMLYRRSNITSLSNNGIPITSLNADVWIKYFFKLEELNYDTIPIIKITDKLGWCDNCSCFVPYTNKVLLDADEKLAKWTNAYISKGTLDEWITAIKDYRKNTLFRFILSCAFCGPLLKLLNQRIFIVFNYGSSRAGKSAGMFSAMSVWGNPDELKTSFNGTSVGIERIAQFQNDVILWLDEKQVNRSQSSIEQLIYLLGNGVGKIRGNKTGGIQHLNTWKLVILASGEETITNSSSTTGIATRCLEIEGSPFDYQEKVAEKVYDKFSNCYGTAGKRFIEILIKKYSKNNYELLKQKFDEVKSKLVEKTTNDINSYISNISVATLADIIISKEVFGEETEELSYKMGLDILNDLNKKDDIDIVEKCYEKVSNWIVSNHRRFDKYIDEIDRENPENDVEGGTTESFGVFEDGTYFVFRNVLENYMVHNGYSYNKMVKDFAKRGYIVPTRNKDGSIKTTSVQKKYRNKNVRMFAFHPEEYEYKIEIDFDISDFKI